MVQGMVPNCHFVYSQACRIDALAIPWFEQGLESNRLQLRDLGERLPGITNGLSEMILWQALTEEEPPDTEREYEIELGSLAFRVGEFHQEFLVRNSESTQCHLQYLYGKRAKFENAIDKHVRRWHTMGRERCYRGGEFDSPMVCFVAIAR